MIIVRATYPEEVLIVIVVKPVMNHHIPCSIVVGKRCGVPPVLETRTGTKVNGGSPPFPLRQIWGNESPELRKAGP